MDQREYSATVVQKFQPEIDLIEYAPEDEEGDIIYEYIEIDEQETERFTIKQEADLYARPTNISNVLKYKCSNRLCKKENIAFETAIELDYHNEIHLEQLKNCMCPICNKTLANQSKLTIHMELRHTAKTFFCDHCGKTFRSKDNLRLHMTHHRKFFYVECRACKRGYKSIQSLRYHLRQHFENYQCETCGMVFEHKKLLLGHVAAKHNQELMVQCHFCTRMFSRTDVRDAHERDIHRNGQFGSHFKCNECSAAFDFRDELMSHKILNHFCGIIHTCEECGKNFKKKSLLDLHMHVHRKKTIQCDVCKMFFTFVTGLNKHRKLGRCKGPPQATLKDSLSREDIAIIAKQQLREITVNPKKEGMDMSSREDDELEEIKSICEEPKKKRPVKVTSQPIVKSIKPPITVRTLTELEIRKQQAPVITSSSGRIIKRKLPTISIQYLPPPSVSVQKKSFICDHCGISKKTKTALLTHLETHTQECQYFCNEPTEYVVVKEKKFECDICKKRYVSSHFLNLHKKSHENLREYKCNAEGCNFDTNSPYDLKNHFKRVHEGDRRFPCPECNKVFKRRCDMNNHRQAIHTDCRVYVKCPICTKIILEKGLQSHIINSHKKAEVRPFVCKYCGKAERYEKNLQRHIDAVHEPKDRGVVYNCPECPASFYRRRELTAHSFDHFVGTVYQCSTCDNKYKSKKELTNHEYQHRGMKYPCPICNLVFQTKSGRGKHVKKHMSGNLKFSEQEEILMLDNDDEGELVYEQLELLDEVEPYVDIG